VQATFVVTDIRMTSDGARAVLTIAVEVTNQAGEVVQKGVNRLMVRR
jgi:acyl dehydratase